MTPEPLRVVFFGTPSFATPTLRMLIDGPHEVVAVVTQPDRRVGRGRKRSQAPPVKVLAEAAGIPVYQPQRLKELRPELEAWAPDVAVVVAYGRIFRPWLLELPRHGCLNIHASILPDLRGPAPVRWAVIRGRKETGVSIMRLDRGVDTGPVERSRRVAIGARQTAPELTELLAELGAQALEETLAAIQQGEARFVPQDDARATHAPLLEKDHGRIDWAQPADVVDRLVRGASPWPLAWVPSPEGPIKILEADFVEGAAGAPGEIVGLDAGDPVVACGLGGLVLRRLQCPGSKAMRGREAVHGRRLSVGARL